MHRMMALGLDMYVLARRVIEFFVSEAMPMVSVCKKTRTENLSAKIIHRSITLMMPGRSTRTIRCRPGPLTDNEMT